MKGVVYIMANRKRTIPIHFDVTEDERNMIVEKMNQFGTENMGAYLRKMAIDGYVIKKDYTELKDIIYEINKIGVNINQIAKKVNEHSSIYKGDVAYLQKRMDDLWQLLNSGLLKQI
jgi:alkyl hydroperoxide reductase subunit AhpC